MNLGQFIDALEKIEPKDSIWIADSPVYLRPTDLDSYRGYYEDLALGVETARSGRPASAVLENAKLALDATFTGYKGGEYRMHLGTRLWLSNYGESGGSLITGIREIAGVGAWEITWRRDE
jgi:hypothetical protein